MTGGLGGPLRTVIGVALLSVLINGLNILSVDPYTQQVLQGLVVIISVGIATRRKLARSESVK